MRLFLRGWLKLLFACALRIARFGAVRRLFLLYLCTLIIALLCLHTPSVPAQTPLREPTAWRAGIFGGYGITYHQAIFDALPGMEINPFYDTLFQQSASPGFSLALLVEKPLSHSFSLAARASYSQLDTRFGSRREIFGRPSGVDIYGVVENTLALSLHSITADPLFAWHPFFGASVYLGAKIGFSWGNSALHREIIDASGQLTFFEDSQRSRTEFTDLPISPIFVPQISITAGASYAIPLNVQETLFLTPELWYSYGITPQLEAWDSPLGAGNIWNIHHLRGGLSFRYSPEAPRIFMPPALVRTAESRQLAINITPIAIDSSLTESPLLRLHIEEFPSRQMHPILPYIFFDAFSDSLPKRYVRLTPAQTWDFSEEHLTQSGTLDIYYHALNILGRRMREHPSATLRLVGTFSDDETELSQDLATRRAEAVMMYLRNVWRISSARISIESRATSAHPPSELSPKQSNKMPHALAQMTKQLREEHRRVEFFSDEWEIIRPIMMTDTVRESQPMAVKFLLRADTKKPIQRWMFTIEQAKRIIRRASGNGAPPKEIVWNPFREQASIPRTEDVIRCNFDFTEENSEGATATISFPVEQTTLAMKFQRGEQNRSADVYRLLNQDIPYPQMHTSARSTLVGNYERLMKSITAHRISARATVTITGYTDKNSELYDNPADNRLRSLERASFVATTLKQVISPGNHVPTPVVKGLGGQAQFYNESTPEGRFYAQMVEIRVETPKE